MDTDTGAIVVTGAGRTGTSLMMQTLRIIGIPVAGVDYCAEFPDNGHHPNGCWQLPIAEVRNGIHGHEYDGKAIKLFGPQLAKSNGELVDRVIVCHRDRDESIASAVKLGSTQEAVDSPLAVEQIASAYDTNYVLIDEWINEWQKRYIDIWFDGMLSQTEEQVRFIGDWLGVLVDDNQMCAVKNNIIRRN